MEHEKNGIKGIISNFILSLVFLILGIAVHTYNLQIDQSNIKLNLDYQKKFKHYQQNNVYFLPVNTIEWVVIRQNEAGYFVTNPDLINEPSQYNKNSLRSTRYATSTLKQLDGLASIDKHATIKFIKDRYREFTSEEGLKFAGFSTLEGGVIGIRTSMDAILTLSSLDSMDKAGVDWAAVRRFIMHHQNPDGGFWDPHYPSFGMNSCLQCSSFALRGLGSLNKFENKSFAEDFKKQLIAYLSASWDSERQAFSSTLGATADDSYDIFRAFIILWNLENADDKTKTNFTLSHFPLEEVKKTLSKHFKTADNTFARKWGGSHPSMKATNLISWMLRDLHALDYLDKKAILDYVFSNERNPGEYGADIYNTYSATSILNTFQVKTKPLAKPLEPSLQQSIFPDFLPYILYLGAIITFIIYLNNDNRKLIDKNLLLESKAFKDKLTGLYNKEFFEKAYAYHKDTDETLSLILIDVDHFKLINDTHGHLEGDMALQAIAELLQKSLRASDTLVRWGGEEFALLCPYTDLNSAIILAEKLREVIASQTFKTIGQITCSFGVSTREQNDSLNQLFERTDKAMYQSKQTGRNKVSYI